MDTELEPEVIEQELAGGVEELRLRLDERDRTIRALNEALERDFDELFEPDRAA